MLFTTHGLHPRVESHLGRLVEAGQSREASVCGRRVDLFEPRNSAAPTAAARLRSRERPTPRRGAAEHGPGASPTLVEELVRLLAALRASGVDEVAAVALRRPQLALRGKLASLNHQPVETARVARRGGSEVKG